ncbi:caspase domain-containing protein [Armillaria novae-zelandiae]|uniref:Caspase domain-containing protein n=1 Tax=Armillaria novae-zelandiae TaxID=153914 RepID=A0AA39TUS0_9AGAR|nr:caspase domain-containing protein [Armillaria novae-zelandiae]
MKATAAAEGLASLTPSGVNMAELVVDNPETLSSEAARFDQAVTSSYEKSGPHDDVPAHDIKQAFNTFMLKLWGAFTNTVFGILQMDLHRRYHVLGSNGDASAKGFTPNAYTGKETTTTTSNKVNTPVKIATDYGGLLHQSRLAFILRKGSRAAFECYKACHQRFASISQSAYETRLRPLKLVPSSIASVAHAKIRKKLLSFSGQSSSRSSKSDRHQYWAVLIGIDGYPTPLRGCVADALIIEKYLTDVLRVPKNRIQYLLGTKSDDSSTRIPHGNSLPTRTNIVDTLLGLSKNPKINNGDSIIIFFSGHGSSYYCPECYRDIFQSESAELAWANKECDPMLCPIEALCPIDRGAPDGQGACVPDISDREINNILTHIYHGKDARITVILDCCHAGGATKEPLNGPVRAAQSLPSRSFVRMLDSAKERMGDWHGYRDVWAEEWIPDMDSHIVLAACKAYQYAKERPHNDGYSGVFTQALVRVLTSGSLKKEATYIDLLKALPMYNDQTPVLDGNRVSECLWL